MADRKLLNNALAKVDRALKVVLVNANSEVVNDGADIHIGRRLRKATDEELENFIKTGRIPEKNGRYFSINPDDLSSKKKKASLNALTEQAQQLPTLNDFGFTFGFATTATEESSEERWNQYLNNNITHKPSNNKAYASQENAIPKDIMEMAKKETKKKTDFIENLPDGQRAELIDGHIYAMATPTRVHQEIVHQLSTDIELYIRSKKGSCKVYPAPFAVYLNKDNKTYVEPDISVICDESKLDEKGCHGSPDWIIEIVSPTSIRNDYYIKLLKYPTAGVREYWIVDPLKKLITVHNFEAETTVMYDFTDKIKVGIYEDLEIDFSKIRI